jgi:predicted metalloprotease with PDZ domain
LARLSQEWSTAEGRHQYGNIYQLGALTGALLDIRILELSGGTKGLRDVTLHLIERYGVERPFDDATFMDDFIAASFPEIKDFMQAHVQSNEPLPYADYFRKLGIEYRESTRTFHVDPEATSDELALRSSWMKNLAQ